MVFLLVLLALLLYKYRYKRRVQGFLGKFPRVSVSSYTKWEKKRSSMGESLLFTDGYHGEALMNEKWGTDRPAAVTYPDLAANTRPKSIDSAPPLITTLGKRKRSSPISPFYFSPLSMGFPQTPPPTVPRRRSSQDSQESVSITSSDNVVFSPFAQTPREGSCRESLVTIASSDIFSPSLLSWPAPPSVAPSVATSPPGTSSSQANLAELAARYRPLTPTKLVTALN